MRVKKLSVILKNRINVMFFKLTFSHFERQS